MNWKTRIALCGGCLMALLPHGYAQQPGGAAIGALTFQQGIITTLAGNGTSGFTGDGGPAGNALITNGIRGIAADSAGDVFFVDDVSFTVRVVYAGGAAAAKLITAENPTVTAPVVGNIYLIAGKEGTGGTPVNGTLASAALFKPGATLGIDLAGDVYLNDLGTNKVWVVYGGGTGTAGSNLIALEAGVTAPVLGATYAVAGNSATSGYTGDGSLATAAGVALRGVNDVKFDTAGDMYLVDQGNNAIRVVSAKTGVISTFAGGGSGMGTAGSSGLNGAATSALLNAPYGLAVDAAGDVYIADKSNHEIKVVYEGGTQAAALINIENKTTATPTPGNIYLVAGGGSAHTPYGGLASASALNSPTMVALDAAGDVYIADNGYAFVTEVNGSTGIMTTVAGSATAGFAGDGGAAASAQLNGIRCVAVDGAGRLYITDATNLRIREVSQGILTFVGQAVGSTSAPQTVTLTNTGNAALDFTGGVPLFGGTNAGDYAIATTSALNTCTQASLQPGASCNVAITYAPTHLGTSAATLTYTTDGILPVQQIQLIGQLTPATTGLAATTTMTYPGQTVTLTATVTSTGTPTGTVTFLQGTTVLLATALPASGVATYTTSALALGSYTYSVKYSGDNSYAGSTSNTVTVNVDSFAMTASSTTLSVAPGQAAQTTLTFTGLGPAVQLLSLSCTGPSSLGCAFTPASASVPVNGSVTVNLSVGAVATTSSLRRSPPLYALAYLPFAGVLGLGFKRRRHPRLLMLALALVFLPLASLCGCAENNIGKRLAAGAQTLTVTAAGPGTNPLTQSVTLTVNVQ
ncbi:NHL repeat-containing protein [Granulicella rosea]|uniref:NHL repeat-containing protein n=1 Tax=Granulicella rosea TaxID=474952 RepID=A0A239LW45_9BACT|nr:Ig-like domain repeat protein [Granulicella rosea]SNT34490.1 NHL repeat-containing protein [Granulicella rosea]